MAKNPAISVIVPVYNVEIYIRQCVDSILKQTFQDFEIILVNDATPDKSFELCKKFYGGNKKVRFVSHEKNLGLGEARNTGMRHARGKYICFVDSDDTILPIALEKFYTAAEKTNAQVVHASGWYELHQDAPEPVLQENLKFAWERHNQEGFLPFNVPYRLDRNWKMMDTWSMAWLCFCRRDFLAENKIEFLPILSEDEPFAFALYCLAERYYVIHEALYIYRRRSGSIMQSTNIDKFSKGINALITAPIYLEKFLDRVPKFPNYDAWREGIISTCFIRFSPHTSPFYRDLNLTLEKISIVEKALAPVFGKNTAFVKFFFNHYNLNNWQTKILMQQKNNNLLLNNFLAEVVQEQPKMLRIMDSVRNVEKRIFLMGTPNHGNLGDQAIVLGELFTLKNHFPDYEIIEIPYTYLTGRLGEFFWGLGFEKFIRKSDIIFLHGGGNLGNLWVNEEQLRRKLIDKFAANKIVIFPQSIYFSEDYTGQQELEISKKIYNAHNDLHLMTRDGNSFELAQKFFPKISTYLLPDAATVLQGITDDVDADREGVLFILRNDKEKVRDENKIQSMKNYFKLNKIPFDNIDTVINEKVTADNREQKIRDVLLKIRRSKLVITDRFHGVIFSFITRTPVLAFKSFDTKISSGIKWFRNVPSIFYAEEETDSIVGTFITRALNLRDNKETLGALNVKLESDSLKRFSDVLNQIVAPNETYSLNINPPPPFAATD